jgi:hypothetical protein
MHGQACTWREERRQYASALLMVGSSNKTSCPPWSPIDQVLAEATYPRLPVASRVSEAIIQSMATLRGRQSPPEPTIGPRALDRPGDIGYNIFVSSGTNSFDNTSKLILFAVLVSRNY